jgi:hypothetical protein
VLPTPPVPVPANQQFAAVHCLCPVYAEGIAGFKQRDPRLLIEWLAAHKAAGFAHVHAYMQEYDDPITRQVLAWYVAEGFVTVHDWTRQSSQQVTHYTYQKAKYLAMGDCWLRARGVSDFMVVGDLDEVRGCGFWLPRGYPKENGSKKH